MVVLYSVEVSKPIDAKKIKQIEQIMKAMKN